MNHCDGFCRPAPNHSANAPVEYKDTPKYRKCKKIAIFEQHLQTRTVMKKILAALSVIAAAAAITGCGNVKQVVAVDTEENTLNIGYGEVSKSDNVYSVGKVNVKQEEASSYSNIYEYLKGRVAGVVIGVGNPPSITIRGVRSLTASNEPLILVDGIEMSDISSIDPNTVKSVDVLKDAATSIYGTRGANGVILITTK